MMDIIAILTLALITVLLMKTHEDEKKRWQEERAELMDRVQSVDYVTYKTVNKPKEKVEKEKPKPPDLV
jgi:hypothetical protein